MANSPLAEFLRSIDIPDCGCRFEETDCTCEAALRGEPCFCRWTPPCEHTLAMHHGLSLDEWRELLNVADPEAMAEGAFLGRSALAFTQEARVELRAERYARGLKLWNRQDVYEEDHVGIAAARGRNGRAFQGALRVAKEAA